MRSWTTISAADQALIRAGWQQVIFDEPLRRERLLSLSADFPLKRLRIHITRNQPFEFVSAVMEPFLAYAGYSAEFLYSAYDDSLAFRFTEPADIEIIWLDFHRYKALTDFGVWLGDRIIELRSRSTAPILVSSSPTRDQDISRILEDIASSLAGVYVCDQWAIAEKLGPGYYDSRIASVTGTLLSGAACLETARMFGLAWIPAAAGERIKAIAVDLDNTLYAGVLGEDGEHGVQLTEGHARLQKKLLECRDRGIFLAIVSRNQVADVVRLFEKRTDFPLRFDHFSAHSIIWNSKGDGMLEIASTLGIGADSMLFLDDNAGELASVAADVPGVRSFHASDPVECERALAIYPGLAGRAKTHTDELRVRDLDASRLRARIREQAEDSQEYLRSLWVQLSFHYNPTRQIRRIHELSIKTNQFNTAFLRLGEAEVARRINDPACAIVTVGLQDRLTDSGIVAAIFGRWEGPCLNIEEIVISCRALGRELETAMIGEAIHGIILRSGHVPPLVVAFTLTISERNWPARAWLERFTGTPATAEGPVHFEWTGREPGTLIQVRSVVSMQWKEHSI